MFPKLPIYFSKCYRNKVTILIQWMAKVTGQLINDTVALLINADEKNLAKLEENMDNIQMIDDDFDNLRTMPKAEAIEKVKSFSNAKPILALANLVQLQKKRLIDFESKKKWASFCSIFLRIMVTIIYHLIPDGVIVADQYVNSGGIALTCEVLALRDHVAHKDDEIQHPNTAYNLSRHLTLLVNVYNFESLQSRLGEVLRENNYFKVLIIYTTSKYLTLIVLFPSLTFICIPG